ncbi:hypothetical protein ABH931_002159 [Streptacidiphilus sp. MAP12-33]|uniref:ScbA/BarX family gamma-butyrolactone biosynthesis protein n=1 Tax=Streptacidiphilus sp. MAP12-33 TaxID=3156266 RepID=UPI0035118030
MSTGTLGRPAQLATPLAGSPEEVRPEQTVPRHLVHRLAISEVLLTDWQRGSADSFELHAQLPRTHSFYDSVDGQHDPLLLAEAVRQAGLLVSHAELGVPRGHQFLMHSLSLECDPAGLLLKASPADLTLRLNCHDLRYRGRMLAGMAYHVHIYRAGAPIGIGKASFDCLSPAVYKRLRQANETAWQSPLPPAVPVSPALVGRDRARDVVLAPTDQPDTWELRVDRDHPVLFDHAVDHVPGMLLLESMRQAARYVSGADPLALLSLQTDFHHYAELDAPCYVQLTREGAGAVTVTVTQRDTAVASGRIVLRA